MEELVGRIAQAAGIGEDVARQAVKIILNFLNREGPSDQVQKILGALPGAQDVIETEGGGSGFLGGLGGMLGGGMGAMAALNELTSAGLDMSQVQSVTRELMATAREHVGAETVDEVVNSIPGLNQVL
ncbi:DUF2267 domain-containing protein [Stappia stellulata]|uniref:DUF2267 domain-containing protein n=1 Tax=Stappia stellulata TaxID=71235 RepID=UPI0003F863EC|nr:DUF2267 domain-containing protein [Stappia stellulata]